MVTFEKIDNNYHKHKEFCDKIDLKPPEWAREEMESIETNGGAILKDPLLLVEGPAQAVTDAVEQKGIAYFREQQAKCMCLHRHLATAARTQHSAVWIDEI